MHQPEVDYYQAMAKGLGDLLVGLLGELRDLGHREDLTLEEVRERCLSSREIVMDALSRLREQKYGAPPRGMA